MQAAILLVMTSSDGDNVAWPQLSRRIFVPSHAGDAMEAALLYAMILHLQVPSNDLLGDISIYCSYHYLQRTDSAIRFPEIWLHDTILQAAHHVQQLSNGDRVTRAGLSMANTAWRRAGDARAQRQGVGRHRCRRLLLLPQVRASKYSI